MNKKNVFRLLAILTVAVLSVGFASCGDDEKEDVIPPANNTTPTSNSEYGKDGLKGYWLSDYVEGNEIQKLFYLDGEGGGTNHSGVFIKSSAYWTERASFVGTFKDYKGVTRTYYSYGAPEEALIYTQQGSTIKIIPSNVENLFMVNVVDGAISGYHRATKVE